MNAKSSNMSSVPVTIVDATSLKMSLGTIFDRVLNEDLKITKHGNPQAVVMSLERYERLSRLEPVDVAALDALRAEFDAKYAHMQSRKQEAAMKQLMDADEDDITAFLGQHYDANPVPPMAKGAPAAPGAKPPKRTRGIVAPNALIPDALSIQEAFAQAGLPIDPSLEPIKHLPLNPVFARGALTPRPAAAMVKATTAVPGGKPSKYRQLLMENKGVYSAESQAALKVYSASGRLIRKGTTVTKANRLVEALTQTVMGKGTASAKPAATTVKVPFSQKKGAK